MNKLAHCYETKRFAHLCSRFDGGTMFQQEFYDFDPTFLARNVQGRETIQCSRIWICFTIQKQLRDAHMTAMSSHMKCSEVILQSRKTN